MNTGAPMSAVTMPTCSSPGYATTRPMTSAASRSGRRDERGEQDRPPVVGSGQPSDRVRDGEPDERDRPGGGHGGSGEQHGDDAADDPHQHDALAEGGGELVTERERVERPTETDRHDEADEHRDDDDPGGPEVLPGERSDLPEPQLVEQGLVRHEDGGRHRGQRGGHHGAGEREADRGEPSPATAAMP